MKFSKAEVDAIIEASPRTFVPFNKLVLSEDHQARSATAPAMSLPELAASIKDSGVLQNLVVVQAARGRYEVCAGGRRLAALTLLVQQGDIADNYPVPVLVVPADKALIASLAENCFHVPMHPADEFAAFARAARAGQVRRGRGRSLRRDAAHRQAAHEARHRLAQADGVVPEGGIGLDCLMVLASVDDHQRQEQAWAGSADLEPAPEHLRQLLTRGEIESDARPAGPVRHRQGLREGRWTRCAATCSATTTARPTCWTRRCWSASPPTSWASARSNSWPRAGSGSTSVRASPTTSTSSTANCASPAASRRPRKPRR
jgi:ParB family chromosome partitioning protein